MPSLNALSVIFVVWGDYIKYLERATADLADAQVIVVDNASPRPVAEHHSYRVIRSDTQLSTGAARNLGLSESDTEYVCFADVDDMLIVDFLTAAIMSLKESDCISYAGKLVHVDSETLEPLGPIWPHKTPTRLGSRPLLLSTVCLFRNMVPIGGAVIRRSAVLEAGGYGDQNLHDDWTLSVVLPLRGTIEFTSKPAVLYRIHPDSQSRRPRPARDYNDARSAVRKRYEASVDLAWAPLVLSLARIVHHRQAIRMSR